MEIFHQQPSLMPLHFMHVLVRGENREMQISTVIRKTFPLMLFGNRVPLTNSYHFTIPTTFKSMIEVIKHMGIPCILKRKNSQFAIHFLFVPILFFIAIWMKLQMQKGDRLYGKDYHQFTYCHFSVLCNKLLQNPYTINNTLKMLHSLTSYFSIKRVWTLLSASR